MSEKKVYKVYQLKKRFISYSLSRVVNGMLVNIEFKGGTNSPIYQGGTFSTDVIAIQKELESMVEYNELFTCIYSSETVKEPAAVVQQKIEAETPVPVQNISVPGITSGVAAKRYLNEAFNIPHSQMPNTKAVMDIAIANNILFPDWKTS